MEKRSNIALVLIVFVVIMAGTAIFLDGRVWHGYQTEEMRIFQRATGGLGMGAIATPIWNLVDYDPRIFAVEDCIAWPVPGGYSYGPDRAASVSFFKEFPENQWIFHEP